MGWIVAGIVIVILVVLMCIERGIK